MIAALLTLALAFPGAASWFPPAGRAALDGPGKLALRYKDDKDKPRKSRAQPFALLYGTVFDQDGRLVRGAQVEVRQRQGKGRWQARTDEQGEFAVRLPPGKAVYIVEARAQGLNPEQKEVEFSADERLDVVLQLKRP